MSLRTNFDGNWNDSCPHCGELHSSHRVIIQQGTESEYHHRMPCEAEKRAIKAKWSADARSAKLLVFILFLLVPLAWILMQQFSSLVGWVAFGYSLIKLAIKGVELFGSPERFIPGYAARKNKELLHRHFIYHCERNPEGFDNLVYHNLKSESSDNGPNQSLERTAIAAVRPTSS